MSPQRLLPSTRIKLKSGAVEHILGPSNAILLLDAAKLLTLRSPSGGSGPRRGADMRELGIIEAGAALIAGGKIVAGGATDEVARHELLISKPAHVDEIDCSGKVLLPGFIDSHTHPVFTAPRSEERRVGKE